MLFFKLKHTQAAVIEQWQIGKVLMTLLQAHTATQPCTNQPLQGRGGGGGGETCVITTRIESIEQSMWLERF